VNEKSRDRGKKRSRGRRSLTHLAEELRPGANFRAEKGKHKSAKEGKHKQGGAKNGDPAKKTSREAQGKRREKEAKDSSAK